MFNEIVTEKIKKFSTCVILDLTYDGHTKYINQLALTKLWKDVCGEVIHCP